jgi:murein L,D-transpeptidase YcbB/YkuD
MRAAVSALALCCGMAVLGTSSAKAMTLMDFIRGGKGHAQQEVDSNQVIIQQGMPVAPVPKTSGGLDGGEPSPKVSAPTYYTYKPEPMRLVAVAKFADPVVTGAVADASATPVAVDQTNGLRRALAQARVMATNDVAKALEVYYSDAKKPLVWVSDNAVNDKAKATLAVLAQADTIGLDPNDYTVALPSIDGSNVNPAARDHALTQFELMLSAKVLAYVQDTVRGRIDPNKLSGYHDFKRKDVNLTPVLTMLSLSPDVSAYLNTRSPSNPQFAELKDEYAKLKAAGSDGAPRLVVTLTGTIKPGDTSAQLPGIIAGIQQRGSDDLKTTNATTLAMFQQTP